jgi:hypothetical protein
MHAIRTTQAAVAAGLLALLGCGRAANERMVRAYSDVLDCVRVERRAAEITLPRKLSPPIRQLAERVLRDSLDSYGELLQPAPSNLTRAVVSPPGEAVLRDRPELAVLRDLDAPQIDRAFATFEVSQGARLLSLLETESEPLLPRFGKALARLRDDTRWHMATAQQWLDLNPPTATHASR